MKNLFPCNSGKGIKANMISPDTFLLEKSQFLGNNQVSHNHKRGSHFQPQWLCNCKYYKEAWSKSLFVFFLHVMWILMHADSDQHPPTRSPQPSNTTLCHQMLVTRCVQAGPEQSAAHDCMETAALTWIRLKSNTLTLLFLLKTPRLCCSDASGEAGRSEKNHI